MEIESVNLTHTCGNNDRVARKRNYLTRDIADCSDIMDIYEPTSTGGNTKQFMAMAKNATGFTVKKGQAARAVKSKSPDCVEAHIGQYFWIPSLFQAYQKDDTEGTYDYESVPCSWDTDSNSLLQFRRCYLALSSAKQFWRKCLICMIVCDGTFTRSRVFKHTILLAETFDGNN